MKYMACGLPVVSVGWEELNRIASPARLTATTDDFVAALRAAVQPHDRQRLIAYAATQNWDARADVIVAALGMR